MCNHADILEVYSFLSVTEFTFSPVLTDAVNQQLITFMLFVALYKRKTFMRKTSTALLTKVENQLLVGQQE